MMKYETASNDQHGTMSDSSSFGIGIDLGGTRIKSARFDLATGKLLATAMTPTRDGERIGGEPAFAVGVRELVQRHETEMGYVAVTIGISAPGLADRDGSCIRFMPGKLDGLEGLVWSNFLNKPAKCLNDAHAALMGEVWQGAAKDKRDVVMLTLGTGVGGAVVCDGRLIQGHIGRAGHLGHLSVAMDDPPSIIGMPGAIEYQIGNGYLAQRTEGRFQMTSDLLSAVGAGDAFAKQVWDRSIQSLATTIAGLINAFDPEVVVLGGGIANAWETIDPPLAAWMDKIEWRPGGYRVPVIHASLGEWAGCYGAVHFAQ
jgi:glucokinase